MQIRRILWPGQAGTKKLRAQYGDNLLCVRYRYDSKNKRRVKTVELIVEEGPWEPEARKIPPNRTMNVRVDYGEIRLGRQIKAVGGKWNWKKKVWELPYHEVVKLELTERIIEPHTQRGLEAEVKKMNGTTTEATGML